MTVTDLRTATAAIVIHHRLQTTFRDGSRVRRDCWPGTWSPAWAVLPGASLVPTSWHETRAEAELAAAKGDAR